MVDYIHLIQAIAMELTGAAQIKLTRCVNWILRLRHNYDKPICRLIGYPASSDLVLYFRIAKYFGRFCN